MCCLSTLDCHTIYFTHHTNIRHNLWHSAENTICCEKCYGLIYFILCLKLLLLSRTWWFEGVVRDNISHPTIRRVHVSNAVLSLISWTEWFFACTALCSGITDPIHVQVWLRYYKHKMKAYALTVCSAAYVCLFYNSTVPENKLT